MSDWPVVDAKEYSKAVMRDRYHRFHALLKEIGELHDRKGDDYDGPPPTEYRNHKQIENWGVAAWKSPMLRVEEKLSRIRTFAQNGKLSTDTLADSMKDIAVLSLIALVLYERGQLEP